MSIQGNMRIPFVPSQQISSGLRNSYGSQQASNLTKTQGPKFYATEFSLQNQGINQQSQTNNYSPQIKSMQSKIEALQSATRKMSDGSVNVVQGRRNSSDHPELKNKNISPMTYFENKMEEAQREADLRGSCPNIFKKLEQSGLRNTTHWNGSFKTNIPFDGSSSNSANVSGKKQFQLPQQIQPSSFLKHQSPKNQLFYGSPVSHSIVVNDEDQKPRIQPINKLGKPTSKSSIQSNPKSAHMAFMASKFNNKNQNNLQTINENKSQCSTSDKVKHFKTLNQIADTKGHKKSEDYKDEQLMKIIKQNQIRIPKVISGFEIGKVLGKGKFGQVLLGRHKQTGLIAALKKIEKSKVKQYKMVQQLKDQIIIHSALDHPNIVRFFGYFEEGDNLYLIIEYMNGGTLFDYLAERDRLSLKQTADFLKDIIAALDYMHDKSIAHRDIKPQNIVLSTEGVAKLCDFGWTAFVGNSRKTYCGTFQYVCPQILERKDYDASVDLWCIGILTYQLLTGNVPFQGEIRNDIMEKIINVDRQKIDYPIDVPEQAKSFIEALIRKDPSQRPKCKELLSHQFITKYASAPSRKKL